MTGGLASAPPEISLTGSTRLQPVYFQPAVFRLEIALGELMTNIKKKNQYTFIEAVAATFPDDPLARKNRILKAAQPSNIGNKREALGVGGKPGGFSAGLGEEDQDRDEEQEDQMAQDRHDREDPEEYDHSDEPDDNMDDTMENGDYNEDDGNMENLRFNSTSDESIMYIISQSRKQGRGNTQDESANIKKHMEGRLTLTLSKLGIRTLEEKN